MNLSQANINLLRTRPHRTKLYLSVYQPSTVLACRVNDGSIAKGQMSITYDTVSVGSYLLVQSGMTMYVGTTAGAYDKGRIRVRSADATTITVAENSDVNWADGDFLTIVNFYEISAVYPRIITDPADPENTLWYKDYDIAYTDQNSVLGSFVCMGCHHAGFLLNGSHDVYYSATGTNHLLGDSLAYFWEFEGGTPTGSNAHTPGLVSYATPGHYTTKLTVSGSSSGDVSYRHVSIYDRPSDGVNVPILQWEMTDFSGTREAGGYRLGIKIHESVPESLIKDGNLIVIFADDWYGGTQTSLGGNADNRSSIVFAGYVLAGTIEYNYRSSTVEFEVGSPSEVMKISPGFAISAESDADPAGRAANDENIPSAWVLVIDMNVRRALFHYLKWHSTALLCNDFQFLGTDQLIQFFSSDRESLYDAINNFMNGTLLGNIVCDRQGKVWAETPIWSADENTYATNFTLQKQDWIDNPSIDETLEKVLSFVEMGGVFYSGITGTFSAFLSHAPGTAPSYRGDLERVQGLALSSQDQLNQLAGDYLAYHNVEFIMDVKLSGNYRHLDIAPQEKIPFNIDPTDTVRGLTFNSRAFFIETMFWGYDPENEFFAPTLVLREHTRGNPGDTIIIPDVPPIQGGSIGGGFDVPPFDVPPLPSPISPGDDTITLIQSGDLDDILLIATLALDTDHDGSGFLIPRNGSDLIDTGNMWSNGQNYIDIDADGIYYVSAWAQAIMADGTPVSCDLYQYTSGEVLYTSLSSINRQDSGSSQNITTAVSYIFEGKNGTRIRMSVGNAPGSNSSFRLQMFKIGIS